MNCVQSCFSESKVNLSSADCEDASMFGTFDYLLDKDCKTESAVWSIGIKMYYIFPLYIYL